MYLELRSLAMTGQIVGVSPSEREDLTGLRIVVMNKLAAEGWCLVSSAILNVGVGEHLVLDTMYFDENFALASEDDDELENLKTMAAPIHPPFRAE